MESWVGLGGKEGCTNIRISAKPGIELGTLWSEGRDLTNCTNHAHPNKVRVKTLDSRAGENPWLSLSFSLIYSWILPNICLGFHQAMKEKRKERLALITASKYRGSAAQRGRTESIYRRPWLPLYGPCVTSEHSVKEGGKPEYLEKNPRSQIEMDKSPPTCGLRELIPGRRGGKREWWPLHQPDSPEGTENMFYN